MKTDYEKVKKILSQHKFADFKLVKGRSSIADLYKKNERCGIYVFRIENGEYYVGQSIDCVKRFSQHIYTDIPDAQEFTCNAYDKDTLDAVEISLISEFRENGLKLRNKIGNWNPLLDYHDDLEAAVAENRKLAEDKINYWLSHNLEYKLNEQKIVAPEQERLYHRNFIKLTEYDDHLKTILPFLKKYFSKCVIQPEVTEMVFWALSCLPGTRGITLCRLNIFWQEVMAAFYLKKEKTYLYIFQLKKSLFKEKDLLKLINKYDSLDVFPNFFYPRGGADQFRMQIYDTAQAMSILDEEIVVNSIKEFNVHLMRLGPTVNVNSKFHCIELSRLILNG